MGFNYSSLIRLQHLAESIRWKHCGYFTRLGLVAPLLLRGNAAVVAVRSAGFWKSRGTSTPSAGAAKKLCCLGQKLRVWFLLGFFFFFSSPHDSPEVLRGLRNAFGLPPRNPSPAHPSASAEAWQAGGRGRGSGAAQGRPRCLSRTGACAGHQRGNNGVLNIY